MHIDMCVVQLMGCRVGTHCSTQRINSLPTFCKSKFGSALVELSVDNLVELSVDNLVELSVDSIS